MGDRNTPASTTNNHFRCCPCVFEMRAKSAAGTPHDGRLPEYLVVVSAKYPAVPLSSVTVAATRNKKQQLCKHNATTNPLPRLPYLLEPNHPDCPWANLLFIFSAVSTWISWRNAFGPGESRPFLLVVPPA